MTKQRTKYLMDNFKLTADKWQKIWDYQGGKCAICGCALKIANTDHDHKSGEVRGLLDHRCNRALGRFGDSLVLLLAAVAYLQDPPARKALGYIHLGFSGRINTKKHRKMLKKLASRLETT
jgi:Recombination endonuclease VII